MQRNLENLLAKIETMLHALTQTARPRLGKEIASGTARSKETSQYKTCKNLTVVVVDRFMVCLWFRKRFQRLGGSKNQTKHLFKEKKYYII
jgi:hypothetical protein